MGNSRSRDRRKESFVFAATAVSEIPEHGTEHSDSDEYDSESDKSDSSNYDIDDYSDQLQLGPASYSFYPRCGDNVMVSGNRRFAKRRRPLSSFNDGVVMTEQHLLANESFKVQIKSMVDKWWGSIEVGVTCLSPVSLDFPFTMTESTFGSTVMWSGDSLLCNGEMIMTLAEDLENCTVGDTISMTLSEEGSLHFGLNGEEVTALNLHLYFRDVNLLHCVVDLYGRTDSAVICESGYVEERSEITSFDVKTSPTEEDYEADPDSVIKQMRMLVLGLKHFAELDMDLTIKLVYLYILKPTTLFENVEFKQKFGDHLANLGVADELKFLLDKLISEVDPMNTKWDSIEVVLVTLINCTDVSLKLCRLCGQCGLVNDLLNNIHKHRNNYDDDEKLHSFVARSIDVLHNCSIAADNRQIYRECGAIDKIAPYVRSDDTDMAATALLTLSHIMENSKKHLLEAEDNIIEFIVRTLDVAVDDESLRCEGFGVLELVVGIGNISVYDKNKISLVNNGIVPLLLKLMHKDLPVEQECAINAFCNLCKLESLRKKLQSRQMP
ncbi:uncharacterized protein [Ptychodera flava]|uniref:uncharacterized protein n=1 Tax=Ptychodera flava TaxID=63121 RepID=UPI00396A79E6